MSRNADPRRKAILAAAFTQFSRYGFRRTSMEDIAKETGTSRASLYSYFENKEEIFRCLSAEIHEGSLGDAESHLKGAASVDLDIASRVEAALIARLAPFQAVVTQSAHGSEIYDENNRLCGGLVLDSSERFRRMLTTALGAGARAGEIDLKAAGLTASAAAELLHLGATGLKQGAPDVATFEKRVHGFVKVFFAGLRG
jgi:AcrR family transcriptional regulator